MSTSSTSTPPTSLLPKHRRFIEEYLLDTNATQAAIRSGYSRKTARQQGARLLTNAAIAAAVKAGQQHTAARLKLTREGIAAELAVLASVRIRPADVSPGEKRAALVDLAKLLGLWQDRHDVTSGGQPMHVEVLTGVARPEGRRAR